MGKDYFLTTNPRVCVDATVVNGPEQAQTVRNYTFVIDLCGYIAVVAPYVNIRSVHFFPDT